MSKHSYSDCMDIGIDYYSQWGTTPMEVGQTYAQAKGEWNECIYKIVHIHNDVALGVLVSGCGRKGRAGLFSNRPINSGWKYDDIRPEYRLQKAGE